MKKVIFNLFIVCHLLVGSAVYANEDLRESDVLVRILSELNATQTLIDEAKHRTDRQGRFGFSYPALVSDLHTIKFGLRSAIYGNRQQIRFVRPLEGDYGDVGVVGEAELLQRLIHELQALSPLLHEAKHSSGREGRVQLNYDALNNDLDTIINGIQQALDGVRDIPREIPPLRGVFSHD